LRGEWSPEVGRGDSKHPSLPLARAERKPFDQKKKTAPRHQRENHFWFSFDTQKRTKLSAKAIYKYKKTFKFSS